ncbi:VCBS domain-containing protein [Litorimonas sp. WD9-15]|uniref:VCBS domain-containing protein n=1 Tax=Litorimonas sp. WD9-15 TaxID=3418716 RepID=UPI003D083CE1
MALSATFTSGDDNVVNAAEQATGIFSILGTGATPNSTVSFNLGGNFFEAMADMNGEFSFDQNSMSNGMPPVSFGSVVQAASDNILSLSLSDTGGQTGSAFLTIDTTAPTAPTISVSNTLVLDGDTTDFVITVVYNELMDESAGNEPSVSLSAVPAGFASPTGVWTNDGMVSTYTVTYSVADLDAEVEDIDITVSGGRDVAENPAAGNVAVAAFSVDMAAPAPGTLSLDNFQDTGPGNVDNSDGITSDNTFDLSLMGQDMDPTTTVAYEVSTDGGMSFTSTTAVQNAIPDGDYVFRAVVMDDSGNSSISNTVSVTVDASADKDTALEVSFADMEISSLESGATFINVVGLDSDASGTLTVTDSAGGTATLMNVSSADLTAGQIAMNISGLADGALMVDFDVTDTAGNTTSASANTAVLDQTPPSVVTFDIVDSSLNVLNNSTTVSIAFSDPVMGFTADDISVPADFTVVLVSGGVGDSVFTAVITAPSGFEGNLQASIAAGTYTDLFGNPGEAGASDTIPVDTAAPAAPTIALTVDTGADGDLITFNGEVTLTDVEMGATVEYSLDNVTFTTTQPNLTDGSNTVYARQIDAANNTGPSASITFTLDTGNPSGFAPLAVNIDEYVEGADPAPVAGDILATLVATDGGAAPELTYTLANDFGGAIALVDNGGNWTLIVADPELFDFEDNSSFEVDLTATDTAGNATTEMFTISLNDLNDAPVIDGSAGVTGGVTERADTNEAAENAPAGFGTAGAFTFTDDDETDSHSVSVANVSSSNGSFLGVFLAGASSPAQGGNTGVISWTFDNLDASDMAIVDALPEGDTITQVYAVTINDGQGGVTTQNVTITITGTNDAAIFAGDVSGAVVEAGGVANADAGTPSVMGTVTVTDVDTGETGFQAAMAADLVGTYGTFTFDETSGAWTYSLDNSAADALNDGQVVTETLTILSLDGTSQDIDVTVTGTNDAPVLAAQVGTVGAVEDGSMVMFDLSAIGSDADAENDGSNLTYSIETAPGEGSAMVSGTNLIFNPGMDFQDLAAGETRDVTVTVLAEDSQGETSNVQTVTFTVTGTNDTPFVVAGGDVSGSLSEGNDAITVSGVFSVTDVDLSDVVSVSNVSVAATGTGAAEAPSEAALLALITEPSNPEIVGSSDATDTLDWTFAAAAGVFDYLNDGDVLVLTYTVTLSDDAMPPATTTQGITITITGTNDAPVFAGDLTGNVVEAGGVANADAGTPSITGTATVTDADTGEGGFGPIAVADLTGDYGTFTFNQSTGAWSYTLNNGTTDALNDMEVVTDTLTVTSLDGTPQDLVVTITGSNDAPVLAAQVGTVAAVEDGAAVTFDLTALGSDADAEDTGASLSYAITTGPSEGTATIVDGELTFDPGMAFQDLADGDTRTVTVQVQATDARAATSNIETITFVITGTNDDPVIDSINGNTGVVTEAAETSATPADNAGDLMVSGAIGFNDLDDGNTFTAEVLSVEIAGGTEPSAEFAGVDLLALMSLVDLDAGTAGIQVDEAGGLQWTFTAGEDLFDYLADGESIVFEYTLRVTDNDGGFDDQILTITVNGANDAPVVTVMNPVDDTEGDSLDSAGDTIAPPLPTAADDVTIDLNTLTTIVEVDESDTQLIDGVTISNTTSAAVLAALGGVSAGDIEALFTIDGDEVTYNRNAPLFDMLGDGESITVDVTFDVTSGPDTVSRTVTLTINGANDTPYFITPLSATEATITEDVGVDGMDNHVRDFTIEFDDVELNDTHTVTILPSGPETADYIGTFSSGFTETATGTGTGEVIFQFVVADSVIENLTSSDSFVQTYAVSVSDGDGATITREIEITIEGTNDAPVITAITPDTGTTIIEDQAVIETGSADTQSLTGTIDFDDVDISSLAIASGVADTNSITATVTGTTLEGAAFAGTIPSGLLTFNVSGANAASTVGNQATWSFDITDGDFDFLAAGEDLVITYDVTVSDGNGGTSTMPLSFTITGTNDLATITGTATGGVTEDDAMANTATGTLTVSDADTGEDVLIAVMAGQDGDNGYGTFEVSAAGVWTYTLDDSDPAVQALPMGATLTDTITVMSADGTASQLITVTITGANDAATFAGDVSGAVVEAGGVANADAGTPSVSGTVTVADVDTGQAGFQAALAGDLVGTYGTFTFNEMTGAWDYTLNNSTADALNDEEVVTDTLTILSTDGTSQDLVVTITGTNDAPVLAVQVGTVSATEDNGSVAFDLTALASDVDAEDTAANLTYAITTAPSEGSASISGGMLIFDPGTDFQELGAGITTTVTVQVQATDASGGTSNIETITFTVTGVNDDAVIAGVATGDVTEDDAMANTATGTLTVTDVDTGENVLVAVTAGTAGDNAYGTFEVSAAGVWTYTLDNMNGVVQALPAGDTLTDTITVMSADGTAMETITVTITGTNDTATIAGLATGDVTEDDAMANTATGTLTVTDVDTGENVLVEVPSGTAGDAGYGTFAVTAAGVWTYTLDNSNSSVQALPAGVTLTDTITVSSEDGTAMETITVTITGTNDTATIAGVSTGNVTEDDAMANTATGTLTVTDVDTGEDVLVAVAAGTAGDAGYGTFEVSAAGVWTYTLDNSNGSVQALPAGDTLTDTITVMSADGTAMETITVTITGTNDTATIAGLATGDVIEDDAMANTATGTLTVTDVDTGENVLVEVPSGTAGDAGYGTFAVTAAGVWTYTLDNSNSSVQALPAGVTLTDTITVSSADGTAMETITVTITGTNDAATIAGLATGGVTEDDAMANTATGTLTVTDVDTGEDVLVEVPAGTAGLNGYGTFEVTAAGVWTYTLDNSNGSVQALPAGVTLTDTITVMSADGTAMETITVTITGTNDAATIAGLATGDVTEDDAMNTASGTLMVTDVDTGETGFQAAAMADLSGTYGTFTFDETSGAWTYTLNNMLAATQGLTDGQDVTETLTILSLDGTSQDIVVTVTGENDLATIVGDVTGAVVEASGDDTPDAGTPSDSGTLTVSDADVGEAVFQVASAGDLAGTYGTFTFDDATGAWTYTLDNTLAATQGLAVGVTAMETLTVLSFDGTATETITVTVTGANDGPDATDDTATVNEGAFGTFNVLFGNSQGVLADSDIDGDSLFVISASDIDDDAEDGVTGNDGVSGLVSGVPQTFFTDFGAEVTVSANGSITYNLTSPTAAFNSLALGEMAIDTFSYTISDGNGGTDTATFSVTIVGTNDPVTAVTDAIVAIEDGAGLTGNLTDNDQDVDTNDTFSIVNITGGSGTSVAARLDGGFDLTLSDGVLVSVDSDGSYTVTAPDSLADGYEVTGNFTYTVQDTGGAQSFATVSISVTGTNDAPDVTMITAPPTDEDQAAVGINLLQGQTDVDMNDAPDVLSVNSIVVTSSDGRTVVFSDVGSVVTIDPAQFNDLAGGDSVTLTITYNVNDGFVDVQNTAELVINGVNDAASIAGLATGDVTEDDAMANTATGTLTVTDVDTGENVLVAVTAGTAGDNAYGTFEVSAAGVWTYTLDNMNGVVQALPAGDTLTDTITVMSADGTAMETITVTITGTNDTATIAGLATGDVTEDDAMANTATGTLTVTDVDTGENVLVEVPSGTAGDAGYGTFAVTAAGVWTYTLDNSNSSVQALPAGVTLTDTITVSSEDGTAMETITVTITGTNDTATIAGVSTGNVTEDDAMANTATGTLTVTDVDTGEDVLVSVTAGTAGDNAYGTFEVSAAGVWTYTLDNSNSAVQALPAGDTLTDTITVMSADGTAMETITVTITGTNDAATIAGLATGDVTEDDAMANTATGTLTVTDVDTGENVLVEVPSGTAGDAGYGTFEVTEAGVWTYTLDNSNGSVQSLPAGVTLTDTITVSSEDGTAMETITVTITGTNDAATIAGVATGDVTEDDAAANTATGTLTVTDVDTGENVLVAVAAGAAGDNGYGTFEVTEAGVWTYTLDNLNPTVNALPAGITLTDTITVMSADGTAMETITVTITGSNDVAAIFGVSTGAVTEDDAAANAASGTLLIDDPDTGEAGFQAAAMADLSGTYGTFTFNEVSGEWTYTLDNSRTVTQALTDGQIVTETLTVLSIDGVSQDIVVTVTGENDAATIAGVATGDVTEDAEINTATGTLTITDVDTGEDVFVAVTAGTAGDNAYGTFEVTEAGVWTYTLDNSNGTVQALPAGVTLTDTITVMSADGTAMETIMVTITGTNDDAIFGGTTTGAVVEAGGVANADAGTPSATGTVTVADVDTGETGFQAVLAADLVGTYGTFSFDETSGAWTYTLNNSTADALDDGETVTETLTIMSLDGTMQDIDVTVTGTNDAPVAMADVNSGIEDGPLILGSVATNDSDVDADAILTYTLADGPVAGLTLSPNGIYSFDTTDAAYQSLNRNETLVLTINYLVTDEQGASTPSTLTITLTGTNDTPVMTAQVGTVAANEDGMAVTFDLSTLGTDADDENDGSNLTYAITTGPSEGSASIMGTDLSFDPGSDFQDLAAGETRIVTMQVQATDAQGAFSNIETISFTVTGVNDAATIAGLATGDVIEDDAAANTATGTLTVTDVDTGEDVLVEVPSGTASDNGYGTFAVTAAGVWTYTLDNSNSAVQALPAGVTLTDTITVSSADGTAMETITVTITGTNDTATIAGVATGDVTEDDAAANTATGTLTITDVDTGEAELVAVPSGTAGDAGYGTFEVTEAGVWTYMLDNSNSSVQALPAGVTLTDTITVMSADGTAMETITVTITGTNDVATIAGVATGDVTEDAMGNTTTGTLTVTDVDTGEDVLVAVTAGTAGDAGYGTFEVTEAGVWTYTLDNSNSTVQALPAGVTLTDTITVMSADGTAMETITVTITGSNDTPVLAGTVTGEVVEDNAFTTSGQITITDVDTGEDLVQAQAAALGSNGLGSFTVLSDGSWTYTLDNDNVAVQGLAVGETTTDSLIVTSLDGSETITLTVTITGGVNIIVGTDEPDTLNGTSDEDDITGGDGDDFIFGNGGDDVIDGGAGNDTIIIGAGMTIIDGGTGLDRVGVDNSVHSVNVNLAVGSATLFDTLGSDIGSLTLSNVEGVRGGAGDDVMVAGTDSVSFSGLDGDDMLTGSAQNDILTGGNGEDILSGGDGIDLIRGGNGNDDLSGGAGNDRLRGNSGEDMIDGGEGNDNIVAGADDDTVYGGEGNDLILGDAGADTLFGDAGNDRINGGADDDFILGGDGADTVNGGSGDDLIFGGRDADILNGDEGADDIRGGSGEDTINGGTGADRLQGNGGNDTFVFGVGTGADQIVDFDDAGNDVMDLTAFGFADFADLQGNISQSGNHVIIDLGNGDEILLLNTDIIDIDDADFLL